jgi:hypothetical protein
MTATAESTIPVAQPESGGSELTRLLATIPAIAQRQDSLADQLQALRFVANRLGMYDAADAIQQIF